MLRPLPNNQAGLLPIPLEGLAPGCLHYQPAGTQHTRQIAPSTGKAYVRGVWDASYITPDYKYTPRGKRLPLPPFGVEPHLCDHLPRGCGHLGIPEDWKRIDRCLAIFMTGSLPRGQRIGRGKHEDTVVRCYGCALCKSNMALS